MAGNTGNKVSQTLLLIKVPHDNAKGAATFEQFLKNLHGIIKGKRISLEIVSLNQHIYLFVWITSDLYEVITGQLYALYPDAEIEMVKDYTILANNMPFVGVELRLARSDLYPIKTYPQFEGDSMGGIFSFLSKANENEQAWIQIVISPDQEEGRLSFGRKFKHFFVKIGTKFNLGKFFRTQSRAHVLKEEQEAIKQKNAKDRFATTIRLAYLSPNPSAARTKLRAFISSFTPFDTSDLNAFKAGRITQSPTFKRQYINRAFGKKQVLNDEEIATIYHLPAGKIEVPNLVITLSRKGEPPRDLPKEEHNSSHELTSFFATTNYHNQYTKFGILRKDRDRHLYVVGKSGVGKSKLLELLVRDDIIHGKGVGVLDPHGDLIDNILKHVPKDRIKDVILFNPADYDYPIAFNPLEKVDMEFRQHVTQGFIEIFKKLFGTNWTSRLEHVLRYTTLALLEYPDSTTLSILKMLTDKNYRQKVVAKVTDPVVKNFWVNEFAAWSEKFDNEAIVPVLNKVGQFVSTSLVRNIVGQPENKIDMYDIMNNKKILLMKVSKGALGEENSDLLGSMLITKIQQAAMKRTFIPEEQRTPFYLYVDEFQHFATKTFAEIFSEARKYKLNLTVSHQYLGQLSEEMKKTAFGNVGGIISFRVGAEDAFWLENEFTPVFKARDIINLPVREFYVKMTINGEVRDAFSGRTLTVPEVSQDNTQEIVEFTRDTYCTTKSVVEELIKEQEKDTMLKEKREREGNMFEAPIV